jgi:hypothetical protein
MLGLLNVSTWVSLALSALSSTALNKWNKMTLKLKLGSLKLALIPLLSNLIPQPYFLEHLGSVEKLKHRKLFSICDLTLVSGLS